MRHLILLFGLISMGLVGMAQPTFPENGVADPRDPCYALTHATIVKDAQTTIPNATLVVRNGRILAVGANVAIPKDAITIDCQGKFIYPSFIDLYADYGVETPKRQGGGGGFFAGQLASNQKGAYGWNQALHPEVDAVKLFVADEAKAKTLRDAGFGTVLTHQRDGIARGTGTLVTLAAEKENKTIIKERASANYSFNKGTSTQSYPNSMMGMIALLRQTYSDAKWYKGNAEKEGVNLTLQAFNANQALPQVFDAGDKWNDLRADRIGDEFGVQYIIKGGGNEYQRAAEVAATKATIILPLNFPAAMDVEDPNDARFVSLTDLKHWELAPTNAAALDKAGASIALTTDGLKDPKGFLGAVRKSIEYGLSETKALDALTRTPATALGVYDKVGSLDAGKLANFLVTSGPIFNEKTTIYQNWVQGNKYGVKEDDWNDIKGTYNVSVTNAAGAVTNYTVDVKGNSSASLIAKDTIATKFNYDGKMVKLGFTPEKKSKNNIRLSGVSNGDSWNGLGEDSAGNRLTWTATLVKAAESKSDSSKAKPAPSLGKLNFPLGPFGFEEQPKAEDLLIKNATVWTNEKEGVLTNTDVLVKGGKIAAVGKNLSGGSAKVIDGTGKHLTAGVIDEHSHIAASSINEGGQSVTSEVRIQDNLYPDDINMYRQLSGGVTSAHILHGSANTIGGQTQLIKLRWGANDEQLKFEGSDPFIKFALGENVKRSSSTNGNQRFPDTRMGVEEVLADAFNRAKAYDAELKKVIADLKAKKSNVDPYTIVRRDLELEALAEILNKKRFITCHSYVQSEINAAMKVGEKYGFTFNTFTHILEGYKVADKMKAHGAAASTFSDWWAYKMEVQDAIPYNATIMQKVGLNVAINSDDAEQARRLNQEAAKSVKYGGMSEEDALKMVTLNPAKMLHVDGRVGSIKPGKDADLVLWTDNPLSIYAMSDKTIVDGIVYFDRDRDRQMHAQVQAERARLINKMVGEKKGGKDVVPAMPSYIIQHSCSEHEHNHGLLVIDAD